MVASNYPLLDIFWSILIFFGLFIWIYLIISIFADIFRSHDIGGFAKAMWVLFVLVIPLFGVLIYLIARGHGMAQRNVKQVQTEQRALDDYVRQTAGGSPADELAKLAKLHEKGKISDEDFAKAKAKIIG